MVFSSVFFTFFFFPSSLLFYYLGRFLDKKLKKTRFADLFLVIFSFLFFSSSNFLSLAWLLAYLLIVFFFSKLIEKKRENADIKGKKILLTTAILILVAMLAYYKYMDFAIEIANSLFKSNYSLSYIATPLGISFITFTAISYLVDVAMKGASAGSFLDCCLYISFFPKIISGPIVLWRDFNKNLYSREINLDKTIEAINKICIGYAKKLIIADSLALTIFEIETSYKQHGVDQITAILLVVLYFFQIYFDFSGYSDIAIGISKLMGFDFDENFNYPYISKSISEFWRRWHISLGNWFKEYIYFSLGGSKKGRFKTARNLMLVFLVTGIWHGAGYNYLIWGILNGIIVVFEHFVRENTFWKKIPSFIKWIGTMFTTMIFWMFFKFQTLDEINDWFKIMLGIKKFDNISFTWQYYLKNSVIVILILALFASSFVAIKKLKDLKKIGKDNEIALIFLEIFYLAIFIISIIYMINSSYSPFIYFQY